MIRKLWRVVKNSAYRRDMRRPEGIEGLERQRPDIEEWAGLWIAVKNGEVLAAEEASRALVAKVLSMGERGRGAVSQFVPRPSNSIVIGVG